MLSIKTLTSQLRKRIQDNRALEVLAWSSTSPLQLGGGKGGTLLLQFLDETPPYSVERDRVLAQLLRCLRATQSQELREVVLYAFIPSIRRTARRLRKTWRAAHSEVLADVFAATMEAIHSYDPDRRSEHVQANVELDLLNAFHRRWNSENRTSEATAMVFLLIRDGEKSSLPELDPSWVFPGKPNKRVQSLTAEERALGRSLLWDLFERRLLTKEEVHLLEAFCLSGRSATAIAEETSVDRRTVVRRVGRIRARIRDAFSTLLGN
jgi:hypothetical protein